jgi:hypothetical protein
MARFTKPGLLALILLTAGCQTTPPERALQLPAASLDIRQMQTRRFAEISEAQLLAASAGVLQDLGFNLDESEVELGLIVASKRQSASDPGVSQVMKLLEIFADIEITVDRDQRIRVSLVSWPVPGADEEHFVRVTFQRVVWNTENDISKRETLDDPILYREFFERLSKSVFLEAHSI